MRGFNEQATEQEPSDASLSSSGVGESGAGPVAVCPSTLSAGYTPEEQAVIGSAELGLGGSYGFIYHDCRVLVAMGVL